MSRMSRVCIAVAALFLVASGPGCAPQERGDILLITIDTLRADHLGLYGYDRPTSPHIDRWFAQAAVFERAYSTEANTPPSVVSLLSGLLPQEHGVRLFYQLVGDDVALIPDLLSAPYQCAGFVANVVLTDEAMGIGARFDHYDDLVDKRAYEDQPAMLAFERNARRTTDAALDWLRTERDPSRPLFLWVHYIDPHQPYDPPEAAPRTFEHDDPVPLPAGKLGLNSPAEPDALVYLDAYDEEIAYMDAQVGRLLDGYASLRNIDDALVLFTADHAESMMEHERWFTHGYRVYEEIIRVPLMLRGPGVQPGRFDVLTSGLDVAPTLLRFAGSSVPRHWTGHDLRAPAAIPHDRIVFAEATSIAKRFGHWRAAVQGDSKWVIRLDKREIERQRFYDLAADPAELKPGDWRSNDPVANQLVELARSDPDPGGIPEDYARGIKLTSPKVSPRATEEQRDALRALGYVE